MKINKLECPCCHQSNYYSHGADYCCVHCGEIFTGKGNWHSYIRDDNR